MIASGALEKRNKLISERGKATRERRSKLQAVTRELKLKPNKVQRESFDRLLLEAKWYRNAALGSGLLEKFDSKLKSVLVKTPAGFEERALEKLGSHHKQSILAELAWNKKSLASLKAKGKKAGALRFTSEVSSLALKQPGVTYAVDGNRARLQGVKGWIPVLGSRQLRDLELANARLVKKASGYYLQVTGFREPVSKRRTSESIGLDMGVSTHVTFSDGRVFSSVVKESERLKRAQRKLARQEKGSNNHTKTLAVIRREHEKLSNKKKELVNQVVSELSGYGTVYYQDEQVASWRQLKHHGLQHSGLGYLKAKLGRLDNSMMLSRWVPTTQWCPKCESRNKLQLSEKEYSCGCGYSEQRDVHAARNMILLGSKTSLGEELAVAPVEVGSSTMGQLDLWQDPPAKQETDDLKSCVPAGLSPAETQ